MRLSACLLASCLALFSLSASAEMVSDLYQVREAVTSQQPDERNAALGKALETLLLRLTGDRKALQNPALAGVRQDPQQLVSRFSYEGDKLVVDFDPLTTENKLREAGLPQWGSNRPAILTWWLNSTAEGSSLLGDAQEAAAPLRQAAQHRGLPLRLPLADLSEQMVATPENLGATQADALQPISERYAADALLAVQAHEDGGQWQAQWRLWLADSREQGTAQAADLNALSDAVMLAVSERLAPRFVVKPGSASAMTVEVQGANLARYAELERLLEPFAARLQQVNGDRMTWQVNASAEQLRAQLGLAGLQEVPADAAPLDASAQPGSTAAPTPAPAPSNLLRFSW
ncbi:DUF2066 domain-containing protein [Aquipseudomonas ullengensis]|uniref:DUF2066 domain-containing protein n=1 Tax=Aquipseudomonas ullengensis TaxID=2759166 RepID=A0A7W4LQ36_9GAMM|nr:DUF2066 domain-containing protein [Pseudomonas ullengensis]MBB2497286.1 DUF2066 domain-containing protein [Pseudomonas ullengensis]